MTPELVVVGLALACAAVLRWFFARLGLLLTVMADRSTVTMALGPLLKTIELEQPPLNQSYGYARFMNVGPLLMESIKISRDEYYIIVSLLGVDYYFVPNSIDSVRGLEYDGWGVSTGRPWLGRLRAHLAWLVTGRFNPSAVYEYEVYGEEE